jgi:hypothetical protein
MACPIAAAVNPRRPGSNSMAVTNLDPGRGTDLGCPPIPHPSGGADWLPLFPKGKGPNRGQRQSRLRGFHSPPPLPLSVHHLRVTYD